MERIRNTERVGETVEILLRRVIYPTDAGRVVADCLESEKDLPLDERNKRFPAVDCGRKGRKYNIYRTTIPLTVHSPRGDLHPWTFRAGRTFEAPSELVKRPSARQLSAFTHTAHCRR